jgi:hypothetical protein
MGEDDRLTCTPVFVVDRNTIEGGECIHIFLLSWFRLLSPAKASRNN